MPADQLGNTYKDKITGFVGVCVAHVEYLTGCNQSLLTPKVKSDGTMMEPVWFDDDRVELVAKAKRVELVRTAAGFDKPAPKR